MSVSVEVRTVNHRFLDVHLRLPKEYSALESDLQQAVRKSISRGRVDITVSIEERKAPEVRIDTLLARSYWNAAEQIRSEFQMGDPLDLRTLMSLPGVVLNRDAGLSMEEREDGPARQATLSSLNNALEGVIRMRDQEGEALSAELHKHLDSISQYARQVRVRTPSLAEEYRKKLEDRLARLQPQNGIDPQRLAQEVALLAEKCDVSEELARLESHVDQFAGWLKGSKEVGKKMDFLLQEMQREVNTILSKASDLEVTRSGIAMKAAIEKLREQIQNVE